jgi:hypothetical protein
MTRFLTTLEPVFPFAAFGADSSPESAFYNMRRKVACRRRSWEISRRKKSNNESVKGFGSMMVKNHTEAHDKRKDLGKLCTAWCASRI